MVHRFRFPSVPLDPSFCEQVSKYYDYMTSVDRLRALMRRNSIIRFQSGELSNGSISMSNMVLDENVKDITGAQMDEKSAGSSSYVDNGKAQSADLQDFFSRPVEIYSLSLSAGSDIFTNYDVWDLYSLDPTVRAKLRNYAYIKGNLHLRISVAGMPFHYGYILASYQPYAVKNQTLQRLSNMMLSFSAGTKGMVANYLSQSAGAVTMDVKANQPTEIVCPYISTKPMHRLYNSAGTAISDVTSFADLQHAGKLYLMTLNPIASTSPTPTNVYIQIYAYMTDVELGCPTGTWLSITTESGYADERETGPVQKFASSAAQISKALTKVPMIAPFAKASTMLFSGISELSAIFGWARPVMIDEPIIVKNLPYQNGANTIGSETSLRITLDPKQELTVDPAVVGIDMDDMTIQKICSIPSYLTQFTWSPSDVQMTPMWSCRVTPSLETSQVNATDYFFQPTAMSFATQPFQYWRGDITFRIQIAASAFHRGKLGIFYEPNVSQFTLINGNVNLNKQFIALVDLQETQTFEVTVKWAAPRHWATVQTLTARESNYGTSINTGSAEYANGYISIVPFTRLQSPDGDSVPINIYAYSPDMKVNCHNSVNLPTARKIRTNSGELETSSVSNIDLNDCSSLVEHISLLHFGEEPVSFRSLLKRYNLTDSTSVLTTASNPSGSVIYIGRVFPTVNLEYNTSAILHQQDLFSYLRYAYLGLRGSMRKRLYVCGSLNQQNNSLVKVSNNVQSGTYAATSLTSSTNIFGSTMAGTVHFALSSNGGVEFEIPHYSPNLFLFSFVEDFIGTNNTGDMLTYWNKNYTAYFDYVTSHGDIRLIEETATGEDFSFLRFTGAPFYSRAI